MGERGHWCCPWQKLAESWRSRLDRAWRRERGAGGGGGGGAGGGWEGGGGGGGGGGWGSLFGCCDHCAIHFPSLGNIHTSQQRATYCYCIVTSGMSRVDAVSPKWLVRVTHRGF